jgi:chemotaxis protein MotB
MERGKSLARSKKTALSIFQQEIKTRKVRVSEDERGLVISLSSELFFEPSSADINMEEANGVLRKVGALLQDEELAKQNRHFRVEGHTDNIPTNPNSPFKTNWELSTARANNILHYLVNLGVDEKRMQVAGMADNRQIGDNTTEAGRAFNNTEEGRAVNRRVDIIILTEGHL